MPNQNPPQIARAAVAVTAFLSLSACVVQISPNHGRFSVDTFDAEHVSNISTVNENISVPTNGEALSIESVNGNIYVDDNASIRSANTVNGNIAIKQNVKIDDNVETVNGTITIENESEIKGDIEAINGDIKLNSVQLNGDIDVVNGNITLDGSSKLRGNIIIRQPEKSFWGNQRLSKNTLQIGKDVSLSGNIILYREVKLRLDNPLLKDKIIYHDSAH